MGSTFREEGLLQTHSRFWPALGVLERLADGGRTDPSLWEKLSQPHTEGDRACGGYFLQRRKIPSTPGLSATLGWCHLPGPHLTPGDGAAAGSW